MITINRHLKFKKYKQFSVTQRCNIDAFQSFENGPRFNICGNCKWGRETYPNSGIINCKRQRN